MSTPQNRITSAAKYRIEIDGLPVIYATEADLPGKKANLHTHQPGNQVNPVYGPSTIEVEEFTFKHATGQGNVDVQMDAWFDRFHQGLDTKRNARLVIFDKTGRTPIRTWEMLNCCPTMVKPESHSGNSTDTSLFSFTLQPEQARII